MRKTSHNEEVPHLRKTFLLLLRKTSHNEEVLFTTIEEVPTFEEVLLRKTIITIFYMKKDKNKIIYILY